MCKPSIGKIIGIAFFVIVAITVFPAITMLLWNWLVPTLFSGPVITYWQALGLIVLSKILFSSGHGGSRHSKYQGQRTWKSHLREKIELKHNQEVRADEAAPSESAELEKE
ncbi:MAG: hypothetical protein HOB84_15400 [Candidatus Marinimicrobia bacterium]|jgi:hypothetical protein|nr:hypothetical protein [Candidatus Neomarinimicrobiota bacterium]MBT4359895.1 hypothetical protein [Candidatus Neomarinimicrobiota bacterium]MBT4716155.1 hypothetical protein [Candidatus Neomarinimicrobiota bacterium]MBT4947657.1 hypothetical protein [Candidatus Neomarinimicrobiota bacterium]MBT5271208.1 hypothetical protein [Candidatus Neomarinimicrobiota bacterium]